MKTLLVSMCFFFGTLPVAVGVAGTSSGTPGPPDSGVNSADSGVRIDSLDVTADSLARKVEQAPSDTARAVALQKLSDYWIFKDSVKAMHYARQILEIPVNQHEQMIRGIGHYQVAGIYMEYFNLDSAQQHHLQAIKLLEQDTVRLSRQYLAKTWYNHGATFQRRGDPQKFMDIVLQKAIPVLESIGDTIQTGIDYIAVAELLMNIGEWDDAAGYFDKAIAILESRPEHEDLPRACIMAARNLLLDENAGSDEDSRKIRAYLDRAQEYMKPGEESYNAILYFANNGMYYFHRENNSPEALKNFDHGLELAAKLGQEYAALDLIYQKFSVFLEEGQYAQAKKTGYEAYEKIKQYSVVGNQLLMLSNLVDLEEKTGNIPRAYALLKRYVALSDSVKTEETRLKILELEKKYEHQKAENEILRLKNENTTKELGLQQARFWAYLAGGIALLLGCSALAGFRIFRNEQQLTRQREQLHRHEIEKVKQAQRLSNFSAMLEGQEQERKRIASELHDGLGGSLSGIKMKLSQAVMEKRQHALPAILSNLDDSVTELRRISRNLMPETLLRYDLVTAIREFCRNMESGGAKIIFQSFGTSHVELPETARTMLYRVVQELVTNAVKHADASRILVQLIHEDTRLSLTVEDDGKGFDPAAGAGKGGVGMTSVRSRVDYLKGSMEFVSEPEIGTTVTVDFDLDAMLHAGKEIPADVVTLKL